MCKQSKKPGEQADNREDNSQRRDNPNFKNVTRNLLE
jgi:hypothetical protein